MSTYKHQVYIPNEIFEDLQKHISSAKHIAFAYSYYYYITHLYRYCQWNKEEKVTQKEIKRKLGLSEIEKRVDYIIKKDGILDKMGYTKTTTNYPISWEIVDGLLEFRTIDDYKKEGYMNIISDRNFKVKTPVKSFFRSKESETLEVLDGTFYEVNNTHCIQYDTFEKIINNKELGYMAFYIYAYLKYKNNHYKEYGMAFRDVEKQLKISKTTFLKYSKSLELNKYIEIHRDKNNYKYKNANFYKVK